MKNATTQGENVTRRKVREGRLRLNGWREGWVGCSADWMKWWIGWTEIHLMWWIDWMKQIDESDTWYGWMSE